MSRLRRIIKTTAAIVPLVLCTASPAYGCLIVPEDQTAAEHSPAITEGPVGTGPQPPFDSLQMADQKNANDQGFDCDPMCTAGEWEDTPAGSKE